jgi:hypothetical protein
MGIREDAIKGLFSFLVDQTFKATVLVKPNPIKAQGKYKLIAGKLAIRETVAEPLKSFPADVDCAVQFVTQEQVAATFPNATVVFMNRTNGINQAAKILGYKVAGEAMKRVPDEGVE